MVYTKKRKIRSSNIWVKLMTTRVHGAPGLDYLIVDPSESPDFEVLSVFHSMDITNNN